MKVLILYISFTPTFRIGCFHSPGQQLLGMYIGTKESFFFFFYRFKGSTPAVVARDTKMANI